MSQFGSLNLSDPWRWRQKTSISNSPRPFQMSDRPFVEAQRLGMTICDAILSSRRSGEVQSEGGWSYAWTPCVSENYNGGWYVKPNPIIQILSASLMIYLYLHVVSRICISLQLKSWLYSTTSPSSKMEPLGMPHHHQSVRERNGCDPPTNRS